MRIGIRQQLALLVLATSLVALAVVSIATWVNNLNFVVDIKSEGLALTASLKASQISSAINLLHSTCSTIVTRVLIQAALARFYQGNTTDANWTRAIGDVQAALTSGGYSTLLQLKIYPRNTTGNLYGLLNVTSSAIDPVALPYTHDNGSAFKLGDPGLGYPPMLYPNLTYQTTNEVDPTDSMTNRTRVYAFPDLELGLSSVVFLGPMRVNQSFAMVSLTIPIISSGSNLNILGFMTVVVDAASICEVLSSREGLGSTGIVFLLGPARAENTFPYTERPSSPGYTANKTALENALVRFVFNPFTINGQANRHDAYSNENGTRFRLVKYPKMLDAFTAINPVTNNASSELTTTNEQGASVAVGYARPQTIVGDWVLAVEETHDEAWAPVVQLKRILLACVFGTLGGVILLVIPVAHYGVLPILRLKDATKRSVQPPGYTPEGSVHESGEGSGDEETAPSASQRSKRGKKWIGKLRRWRYGQSKSHAERKEDAKRRVFKIPAKVQDRKHLITDELTELTGTFNEMSDELMMQYARLEEKVAERTQELEISKKAAEAANESKTLFIANISHELKTPLNGILGMCSVCMGDDDLDRIKKSLQVVYKSGDLLLHLLNDLLTFSKNQIGQDLSLEEREFSLFDIRSQITTIFDKQVREGHINFGVNFIGTEEFESGPDETLERSPEKALPALGPQGTGQLKDMRLWGDQHRILQVIINLVSNSLKFTPEGGKVEVRIKCLGEAAKFSSSGSGSRNESSGSRHGSQRLSRNRHRVGSGSNTSVSSRVQSSSATAAKPVGTALLINPMAPKGAQQHLHVRERLPTPPPANARTLLFEFEVEDSGPGIPPALQHRVFEPFVQGDLGLSKRHAGTGLGLSICSQLASLMGGTITLDSVADVGSTFTMRIPLKFVKARSHSTASSENARSSTIPDAPRSVKRVSRDASPVRTTLNGNKALSFDKDPQPRLVGLSQPFFAATGIAPPLLAGPGQLDVLNHVGAHKSSSDKIRVLVAEDNLVNQEVVLRMLKLEDIYNVTVARDGQEAYEMVKASMESGEAYNLIFMDIQMPNLDGLQSTRLIRQMGYSAPIVALTAFAEESNVKECMESGMNMFLSKPIRRPALQQVLQKFATIPEESEAGSLARRKPSEEFNEKAQSDTIGGSDEPAAMNGSTKEKEPI